jgi:ubiquinol-cytochrome c reductase cytochrome b subunit
MYPYFMVKTGAFFFFVFGVLAFMATFFQVNPIWLYGPYNPVSISAGSQPDFYMGFLEGTLRMFPSWTWDVAGHTVPWDVLIPALVPLGILFTGMALWPFIERWATGDQREHNVLDRPRNAPTRTGLGVAAIIFYIVCLMEGANDLIAVHLNISLYLVTEISRYVVFIGPALAYFITKRICLGLQRKDRELLAHGMETGIIHQMPDGEFVEIHRPVSEEKRAVLLSNEAPLELPAAGATDENGIPAPATRGMAGRLRATANRVITESVRLDVGDGHANGHGNGHGAPLEEGEHAAVGSSQPPAAGQGEPGQEEHGPSGGAGS